MKNNDSVGLNLSYKDQLQKALNDPEKAMRLGIFDAKRHDQQDVFLTWETREQGSTRGMIDAYKTMLQDINEPLSFELINKIRKGLFKNTSHYGDAVDNEKGANLLDQVAQEERSYEMPKEGIDKEYLNKRAETLQENFKLTSPPYSITDSAYKNKFSFNPKCTKKELEQLFISMINQYNEKQKESTTKDAKLINILEFVSDAERVHPYGDFNGRTFSVLILNRELVKNNLCPTLIDDTHVIDYKKIDELKEEVKKGQGNFEKLYEKSKVNDSHPSINDWNGAILAELNKLTNAPKSMDFEKDMQNMMSQNRCTDIISELSALRNNEPSAYLAKDVKFEGAREAYSAEVSSESKKSVSSEKSNKSSEEKNWGNLSQPLNNTEKSLQENHFDKNTLHEALQILQEVKKSTQERIQNLNKIDKKVDSLLQSNQNIKQELNSLKSYER